MPVVVATGAAEGPDVADPRRVAVEWSAGLAGVLLLLVGALRLPAWARERARQFEALAAYARRLAAFGVHDPPEEAAAGTRARTGWEGGGARPGRIGRHLHSRRAGRGRGAVRVLWRWSREEHTTLPLRSSKFHRRG